MNPEHEPSQFSYCGMGLVEEVEPNLEDTNLQNLSCVWWYQGLFIVDFIDTQVNKPDITWN